MKKSLLTTLVAAPLLSLSSLAFAADPVLLTESQMDGVTAGFLDHKEGNDSTAVIGQLNVSPVTVVQVNVLSVGSSNAAEIVSGNFGAIMQ
jgi:hypothetical protein